LEHATIRRYSVKERPTLREAYDAVRAGVSGHKTILVVGNCWVDYEGRASSRLEPGERVVIFKSDGSALIHRPRDYAPVNWQPPGSLFRTRLVKDGLHVRVFRKKDNEVMELTFDDVMFTAVLDLKDSGEFYLHASEKDMQEAILYEPSLLEKGFKPLTAEKPVEPGFIDILGVDKDGILTVVEIKRKPATKEAVLQLNKYMAVFRADSDRQIRGILVAPALARGSQKLLASLGLEFKPLSPEQCSQILRRYREKPLTDFFEP